jgi:type IV pilus biogenesis protein CpaD/CtpE
MLSIRKYVLLFALASLLAGCAESMPVPRLPDFSRITQKVLTPAEQEQAIKAISATQQDQQAQAVKTIETTRAK